MEFFKQPEDSLTVAADCWQLLEHAVGESNCGWRLPVLATVADGICRQRIVVLRAVDTARRTILAHTDSRSPKVQSLGNGKTASWLFYDAALKVQMQFVGQTRIHVNDAVTKELWEQQPISSLRGYLAPMPPGMQLDSANVNLPDHLRGRLPDAEEVSAGRENFAVISCTAVQIEWLQLGQSGNLRLRVTYSPDGERNVEWLAP